MDTIYKYIGKDTLYHVPARDLTQADLDERAELWAENGITEDLLLASGLYAKAGAPEKKKPTKKGSAYLEAAKDGE